ncbi:K(+) efflux antiporter 5 [Capsicum annuum]|nr:K(+) efflux antiporter 5 [Capsicum annuum]
MERIVVRREKLRAWIFLFVSVAYCGRMSLAVRSEKEMRARFYGNLVNSSAPDTNDGTIAKMFDRVLEKEFSENDQPEGSDGSSFNSTVADEKGVLETVAKITREKIKRNETQQTNDTRSFKLQDVFSLENEGSDDVTTLIDKKDNVFVMSNKKSKYPVLQVDVRLISDLVVVIVSAAIGGISFSCLGQPVIVGYLLAGSLIGPGGLKFISEMVQWSVVQASSHFLSSVIPLLAAIAVPSKLVCLLFQEVLVLLLMVETVAQFGVVFLLFALGLEFSLTKLKVVGPVAVLGGLLQIVILMFLCGTTAMFCGANLSEGVFVGCFLSMSSTAVVVKFLVEKNSNNALHGQVTIGTLIFQAADLIHVPQCCVDFNLVICSPFSEVDDSFIFSKMEKGQTLGDFFPSILALVDRVTWYPLLVGGDRYPVELVETNELYQLAVVAFCLLSAWCSDKLGLSLELGSFVAGVMISTTDFAQHTLDQVEPIRNLFSALFLASIGMLIHVQFLWTHVDILLASVILVIVFKTTVAAMITRIFGYNIRTSVIVGLLLAQIGEFAFVLLSRASNLHIVQGKMYVLLLGTTALSLVTTPVLFKLIPAIMHLGVLMHWFPVENVVVQDEVVFLTEITD